MPETPDPLAQSLTLRVAAEVRAEIARQQMTHSRLGELIGLSQPQITKRLNGVMPMDTAELEKIAAALGVPVDRFLAVPASLPAGAA